MSYKNDKEAYCLGIQYALLPAAKCHATGGSQVVEGKYEPDHDQTSNPRCVVLAHWYDHTNVLVRYNTNLNFTIPYHVAGTLTPDAAGDYACESEYEEEFTYVLEDRTFFLWWDGIDSWIISGSVGWKEGPYWSRADPAIAGDYAPYGGAAGIAAVVAGPE